MKFPYPLVYCEWEDHHADSGWKAMDVVDHTPVLCSSIGWLIKEDDKAITLAANLASGLESGIGNTQFILKICLKKRKQLRKASIT